MLSEKYIRTLFQTYWTTKTKLLKTLPGMTDVGLNQLALLMLEGARLIVEEEAPLDPTIKKPRKKFKKKRLRKKPPTVETVTAKTPPAETVKKRLRKTPRKTLRKKRLRKKAPTAETAKTTTAETVKKPRKKRLRKKVPTAETAKKPESTLVLSVRSVDSRKIPIVVGI